jgi:hypothetical protein
MTLVCRIVVFATGAHFPLHTFLFFFLVLLMHKDGDWSPLIELWVYSVWLQFFVGICFPCISLSIVNSHNRSNRPIVHDSIHNRTFFVLGRALQ